MRILVIGGTGYIGSYVSARLAAMGHEITVYHRGKTEPGLPNTIRHVHRPEATIPIRHYPAELMSPPPDVVLHMVLVGEADAVAFMQAFRGVARRVVAISSGDVYRAYGRLISLEPGLPEPSPLRETSPLRERLFPYRTEREARPEGGATWVHDYEKILVERVVMGDPSLLGQFCACRWSTAPAMGNAASTIT